MLFQQFSCKKKTLRNGSYCNQKFIIIWLIYSIYSIIISTGTIKQNYYLNNCIIENLYENDVANVKKWKDLNFSYYDEVLIFSIPRFLIIKFLLQNKEKTERHKLLSFQGMSAKRLRLRKGFEPAPHLS